MIYGNSKEAPARPFSLKGNLDFHSILQGLLLDPPPLEKSLIESLLQAIEVMLQRPWEDLKLPGGRALEPRSPIPPPDSPWGNRTPDSLPPKNLQGVGKFAPYIEEAASTYGVDPTLIQAVIQAESNGNPRAISPAGAQGLMQLMPATAKELGVKDPFDPAENIMAGTRYLRRLLDRYQGNTRLALAAYNWGMGNLESRPHALPKETRDYIARVENYRGGKRETTWVA